MTRMLHHRVATEAENGQTDLNMDLSHRDHPVTDHLLVLQYEK